MHGRRCRDVGSSSSSAARAGSKTSASYIRLQCRFGGIKEWKRKPPLPDLNDHRDMLSVELLGRMDRLKTFQWEGTGNDKEMTPPLESLRASDQYRDSLWKTLVSRRSELEEIVVEDRFARGLCAKDARSKDNEAPTVAVSPATDHGVASNEGLQYPAPAALPNLSKVDWRLATCRRCDEPHHHFGPVRDLLTCSPNLENLRLKGPVPLGIKFADL